MMYFNSIQSYVGLLVKNVYLKKNNLCSKELYKSVKPYSQIPPCREEKVA